MNWKEDLGKLKQFLCGGSSKVRGFFQDQEEGYQ